MIFHINPLVFSWGSIPGHIVCRRPPSSSSPSCWAGPSSGSRSTASAPMSPGQRGLRGPGTSCGPNSLERGHFVGMNDWSPLRNSDIFRRGGEKLKKASSNSWLWNIVFGTRLQRAMERSAILNGKTHYCIWSFSIAMLNYHRVYETGW